MFLIFHNTRLTNKKKIANSYTDNKKENQNEVREKNLNRRGRPYKIKHFSHALAINKPTLELSEISL